MKTIFTIYAIALSIISVIVIGGCAYYGSLWGSVLGWCGFAVSIGIGVHLLNKKEEEEK